MKDQLRKELTDSMINIYSMDIIPLLAGFLQGEQAVMVTMHRLELNTPTLICKAAGIAKNRMSAIISSLCKKGYVNVVPDANDKRKISLTLTQEGIRYITEKEELANKIFDKFIDALGDKNIRELIRIIDLATKLGSVK